MADKYKIFKSGTLVYFFSTSTKSKPECLNWIALQFDYLNFYTVHLNGELIFRKAK